MPIEVRPATMEDIAGFLADGESVAPSFKGTAVLKDGEVVCVGGLAFYKGRVVLFNDVRPEGRKYKTRLHKEALKILEQARGRHPLIYAIADENEPGASRWLERLGFTHFEGNLYRLWLI